MFVSIEPPLWSVLDPQPMKRNKAVLLDNSFYLWYHSKGTVKGSRHFQ